MSDSNWGIRSALVAIALACSPYQGGAAQGDTSNPAKEIADSDGISPSQQQITSPPPTPDLPEPASNEPDYGREDLEAQKTMAWWTRAMGIAAIVGVILSGIGVALIYTTFKATLRAARYAGVAARQSRQSLAVIKESSAAQLRPYVAISEFEGDDNSPFSRDSHVRFRIKNFGQTPATRVVVSVGALSEKVPIADTSVDFAKTGEFGLLAPDDSRDDKISLKHMPVESLGGIASGTHKVLLRLRVDYEWPGGADCHDVTMILTNPARNSWNLPHEDHRQQ